ncbi:MAG: RhuM family protein, partial [Steroidobacteraceae bacterium]
GRTVNREVAHYNLDVIISVGYRVKSAQGTRFRQWATATLREHLVRGYTRNLDQSVFGEPAYPTMESKAAHLLYFVIKNHPFSDGNKRIGSFLFVDFLNRNGRLFRDGEVVINDVGLAALALLVAESLPKDKDVMVRLVMNMLAQRAA